MVMTAWAPTPTWFRSAASNAGLGLARIIGGLGADARYSSARSKSLNYGLMYSGYSLGNSGGGADRRILAANHGWRPLVLWRISGSAAASDVLPSVPYSLDFLLAKRRMDAGAKARCAAWHGRCGRYGASQG